MSPHGTRTRYVHDKCRCKKCRQANTDFQKNWRHATGRTAPPACIECGGLLPDKITHAYCEEHRHGKYHTYNRGCRCEPCTKANADRLLAYYHKVGRSKSYRKRWKYA